MNLQVPSSGANGRGNARFSRSKAISTDWALSYKQLILSAAAAAGDDDKIIITKY